MATSELNYPGATIFWLYIVAALVFTGTTLRTLIDAARSNSIREDNGQRARYIRLFGTLAAISFACLSFNMLHVLVQSFRLWSQHHPTALGSLSLHNIWQWSITSTLFHDFGEAIVADPVRYWWTQAALLATFSVCLHMGSEGKARAVPRLWSFFCLAQILPVSFVQNLFYVAQLQHPTRLSRYGLPSGAVVALALTYAACLVVAPHSAHTPALIPLILVTRVLLVAPLGLGSVSTAEGPRAGSWATRVVWQALWLAGVGLTLRQSVLAWQQMDAASHLLEALFVHPAVTSLGWDFLLSVISATAWSVCCKTSGEHHLDKKAL